MIRDRNASACAVFRRRAHPARTCRSSSVSKSGSSFGLGITQAYSSDQELLTQDTSSLTAESLPEDWYGLKITGSDVGPALS